MRPVIQKANIDFELGVGGLGDVSDGGRSLRGTGGSGSYEREDVPGIGGYCISSTSDCDCRSQGVDYYVFVLYRNSNMPCSLVRVPMLLCKASRLVMVFWAFSCSSRLIRGLAQSGKGKPVKRWDPVTKGFLSIGAFFTKPISTPLHQYSPKFISIITAAIHRS